ncbi:MAG: hypothetical protein QW806_09850 [Nitrososphaerota archaeon]
MKLANKVYTSSRLPQITYPGQLWFDESINKLKIFDGTTFQPLDFFDYNITVPQDIDLSQVTSPFTLIPKQRAKLMFTGNEIDLTKILLENKGTDLYDIELTIFTPATIYSIELIHGFGNSITTTTQYSGATLQKSTFLYNGDVAFRDHNHTKFERRFINTDRFSIVPSSLGLLSPISCKFYLVYRGHTDRRSLHYEVYGQKNMLIGSVQALSNGNRWNSMGKIIISSDTTVSGHILVYRHM